jgi:FMN phosphatase YigB (HAD superfamily)
MVKFESPELVVFDLDNTLYEYKQCHAAGELAFGELANNVFGMSNKDVQKNLSRARSIVKKRVKGASSHDRLLYFSEFLNISGIPSDIKFLIDAENHYWASYFEVMELADDIDSLLIELRLKKIEVALVTNLLSGIQYRKMAKLGIANMFDIVITSQETIGEKDSFEPFALLIERLKPKKSLNSVWFVGDEISDFPLNFPSSSKKCFVSPFSSIKKTSLDLIYLSNYKQLLRYINS